MTGPELHRHRPTEVATTVHCPSDLALDQHVAGEDHARDGAVAAHVAICPACRARVAERVAGFAAYPETDPERLLGAIRARIATAGAAPAPRPRRLAVLWRRLTAPGAWALWAVPAAAVIVAAVWFTLPGSGSDPDGPGRAGLRLKGGVALHVYRLTPAGSEEVPSGARFRPGDRLRFVVDLPHEGHVLVVGVEPDGRVYEAWPLGDHSTLHPAGPGQALPGAVALDARPGREVLHLVHCPPATGRPRCQTGGAERAPVCPEGCTLRAFVLDKAP